MRRNDGFTLLELVIVIAILAVVAGALIVVLGDVQQETTTDLSRVEMVRIRDAVLRFQRDTGFLPGEGPFRLATQAPPGSIPADRLPGTVPVAQHVSWFESPANVWLLTGRDGPCPSGTPANPQSPLCGTGHPLETWNPDTGRGWRGPYVTRQGEGLVDLGDGLAADGTGSPTTGGTALLPEVRGVADAFVARPEACNPGGVPTQCFTWRTVPGGAPLAGRGRPYLLFDVGNTDATRVVGMGPDQDYGTQDDLAVFLFK